MKESAARQVGEVLERRPLNAGSAEVARLWRWLLLASAVFVVYGSLVPLNFQPMPWADAFAHFMDFAAGELSSGSRIDKASNVLLTVPVAFAAAQCLLPGRSLIIAFLWRVMIVVGVLLLSMGVEFAQQFFPPRTMSWSDVGAQAFGTLIGLLAQQRWGAAVSRWLLGWWRREHDSVRPIRLLKAYLALLLGFSMLPLDLTVNPVEIYHKWAGGRVILLPFAGLEGDLSERLYECVTDAGIWLPVGVFLCLSSPLTALQTLFRGLLLAAVIEFLQLFVFTRVTDVTDVLLAGVGVMLGRTGLHLWMSNAPALSVHRERLSLNVPTVRAAERLGRVTPFSTLGIQLVCTAALSMTLSWVVNYPGMPYNVRELISVGPYGLVSSLSLSVSLLLLANGPFLLLNLAPLWALAAPLGLGVIGALCFALLRVGVHLESIHDVVGSPVLGWPWEWERLLRFIALWTAIGLQVALAILFVAMLIDPRRLPAFVNGLLVTLLLAYPLYWVVVVRAATDNLVELMAHQASFAAASWLAVGALGICLAASSLSVLIAVPHRWRTLLPVIVLGSLLAPLALVAGLEENVIKYEKVFSALQFLLSTDRSQYVTGMALWGRFSAVLAVLVCGLAVLQHVGWRLASGKLSSARRAGGLLRVRTAAEP